MAVEGNTQHGNSQQECYVLKFLILILIGLTDSPDDDADEQDNIHNLTRIEWHTQYVDKQQFEPATNLYNARNDTIEYGSQDDY